MLWHSGARENYSWNRDDLSKLEPWTKYSTLDHNINGKFETFDLFYVYISLLSSTLASVVVILKGFHLPVPAGVDTSLPLQI